MARSIFATNYGKGGTTSPLDKLVMSLTNQYASDKSLQRIIQGARGTGTIAGPVTDLLNGYLGIGSTPASTTAGTEGTAGSTLPATGAYANAGGEEQVYKSAATGWDPSLVPTQSTLKDRRTGASKWVERFVPVCDYVGADNVLIAFGDPIFSKNGPMDDLKAVGLCSDFALQVGKNVTTLKELRAESTIVLPGKSTPGSVSITRAMFHGPSAQALISNAIGASDENLGWAMDTSDPSSKALFGMLFLFLSHKRSDVAALYCERCCITSIAVGGQAGQPGLVERIGITFGRLITQNFAKDQTTTPADLSGSSGQDLFGEGDGGEEFEGTDYSDLFNEIPSNDADGPVYLAGMAEDPDYRIG